MLKKGYEPDDEKVPPASRLRFGPGARVVCKVGQQPEVKWVPGTIIAAYELPYKIALDSGGRVNAPQAGSHSPAPKTTTRGWPMAEPANGRAGEPESRRAGERESRRRPRT